MSSGGPKVLYLRCHGASKLRSCFGPLMCGRFALASIRMSGPWDETTDWKHKKKIRRNFRNHPFIPTYEGFLKFRRHFFLALPVRGFIPGP